MSASEEEKRKRAQHFAEVQERAKKMTPAEMQFRHKGILYPTLMCSEEGLHAMETLEAREDDVLIITYPKCGTNWSLQILTEMLTAMHNKAPSKDFAMLEFGKPEKFQQLKQLPSPRLFASHVTYGNLPKSFLEKKTKILVILRNPKDTAVSFFHFTNKNPVLPTYESWDLFFKDFITGNVLYGSYFDYHLEWDKHIDDGNLLVLTFEEMKEDLPAQLRKICNFYGLTLTEEQISLVQEKSTFTSMKEKSSTTHGNLGDVFFRKGEVGDWKSLFTKEQSKEVDAKFEECLAGTKLGKMINYAKYCTY
ncbi:sulfotransferase 6B1-like [Hyperolius riggenbachi]|uniref:sulfotransferase 6B1-like n=1 Tax=Hyperolius riggenbachi TaxID=752182 RepID=UPI0035A344B7